MAKLSLRFWFAVLGVIIIAAAILVGSLIGWTSYVADTWQLSPNPNESITPSVTSTEGASVSKLSPERRIDIAKLALSTTAGAAAIITTLAAWIALRNSWEQRNLQRLNTALDHLKEDKTFIRARGLAELTALAERSGGCSRQAFDAICAYIRSSSTGLASDLNDSVSEDAVTVIIQHYRAKHGLFGRVCGRLCRKSWSHWPLNLKDARLPTSASDWSDCQFSEVSFRGVVFPDVDIHFCRARFKDPSQVTFSEAQVQRKIYTSRYPVGKDPFASLDRPVECRVYDDDPIQGHTRCPLGE